MAEMSDSAMKAFTAAHTVRSQQPMLVSFSHFLAVLLEEAQRPSLPLPSLCPPSCGAKWMMDSTDLKPWEPDALILLKGYD